MLCNIPLETRSAITYLLRHIYFRQHMFHAGTINYNTIHTSNLFSTKYRSLNIKRLWKVVDFALNSKLSNNYISHLYGAKNEKNIALGKVWLFRKIKS